MESISTLADENWIGQMAYYDLEAYDKNASEEWKAGWKQAQADDLDFQCQCEMEERYYYA